MKKANIKSAHSIAYWWGKWPAWVGYAASAWSLAYAALGIYWKLEGRGFPFGENDPTNISILNRLTPEVGAPVINVLGFAAAGVAVCMAQMQGQGISRVLLIGFGLTISLALLFIIPDYRVLMAVAYGVVFVVGAPFNWPPANYSDIITWPVINQFILLLGGLLWAASTLAYQRKTKFACGNCGRSDIRPVWKTPWGAGRWGKWATYIAFFIPLIYSITRWAWALGIPLGITEELLREGQGSGMWLAGAALATVSLVGAVLTLGLIQRWGEIFPAWVPLLRGKSVPLALAVIPATLISILIIAAGVMFIRLTLAGVFDEFFGPGNPATYAPELLWPIWGFSLGAASLAYYFRRRGRCAYCGRL
jgi:hypothetical protein